MRDDNFFCLQVLLTKTEIRVTHFPPTISPAEKLRDVKALYEELFAPTGGVQRSQKLATRKSTKEMGAKKTKSSTCLRRNLLPTQSNSMQMRYAS
jgi:hypothetical protein